MKNVPTLFGIDIEFLTQKSSIPMLNIGIGTFSNRPKKYQEEKFNYIH